MTVISGWLGLLAAYELGQEERQETGSHMRANKRIFYPCVGVLCREEDIVQTVCAADQQHDFCGRACRAHRSAILRWLHPLRLAASYSHASFKQCSEHLGPSEQLPTLLGRSVFRNLVLWQLHEGMLACRIVAVCSNSLVYFIGQPSNGCEMPYVDLQHRLLVYRVLGH